MKKCPSCAEEVQDEAKKCRHCGESFVKTPTWVWVGIAIVIAFVVLGLVVSGTIYVRPIAAIVDPHGYPPGVSGPPADWVPGPSHEERMR